MRELKAMDFLQTMIPDGVWLNKINYDGEKVNFSGSALNDKELDTFVTGLMDSSYFEDVVLIQQTVEKTDSGPVKNFEVSSAMGKL